MEGEGGGRNWCKASQDSGEGSEELEVERMGMGFVGQRGGVGGL